MDGSCLSLTAFTSLAGQIKAFLRLYTGNPTSGVIARGVGVSKTRVTPVLKQLVASGEICISGAKGWYYLPEENP